MFSSHAEKQIIAFVAWEQVVEAMTSNSPRSWKRARKAEAEDEVEIFVSRIPCRWCEDLCQKTNAFLGMNMKLVFIRRVQNLADRCKCGGCICELPTPKVIIPMLENIAVGELLEPLLPSPQTPTKIYSTRQKTTILAERPSKNHKKLAAAAPFLTPETTSRTPIKPQKSVEKLLVSGSKRTQRSIPSEFEMSDTEEEWIPVDMPPTPIKFPALSKSMAKSTRKSLKSILASPRSNSNITAPLKAKPVILDSDSDSDISEWKPKQSSATKRKSSTGMLEASPSKRPYFEPHRTSSLTNNGSRQVVQKNSSSVVSLTQYLYNQEKTVISVKTSPVKSGSVRSSPMKKAKSKGRPRKRRINSEVNEDELW
jgi:hypothetical protein